MKRKLFIVFIVLIAFVCGYCTASLSPERKINVFGTYVQDFSTISINHNLTYQFRYPFSEGQLIKIDDVTYKLKNGDLNDCILLFFEDELKLVDIKNEQIKEFTKNTSSESQLK